MTIKITLEESRSFLWQKLRKHCEERIQSYYAFTSNPELPHDQKQVICGRIAELRTLLALEPEKP